MAVEYTAERDPKALKELRKLDGAVRLQYCESLKSAKAARECLAMRFMA